MQQSGFYDDNDRIWDQALPLLTCGSGPLLRMAEYSSQVGYKLLLQAMALCQSRSVVYKIYLAHEEGVLNFQIRSGNFILIVGVWYFMGHYWVLKICQKLPSH